MIMQTVIMVLGERRALLFVRSLLVSPPARYYYVRYYHRKSARMVQSCRDKRLPGAISRSYYARKREVVVASSPGPHPRATSLPT